MYLFQGAVEIQTELKCTGPPPAHIGDTAFIELQDEVNRVVHDSVVGFQGAISAEHGLGALKRDEIRRYKSAIEIDIDIDMMQAIKHALDPQNLMKPGKVVKVSPRASTRVGSKRACSLPTASLFRFHLDQNFFSGMELVRQPSDIRSAMQEALKLIIKKINGRSIPLIYNHSDIINSIILSASSRPPINECWRDQ